VQTQPLSFYYWSQTSALRATARQPLTFLCRLPAYVKSLRRQGFTDDDVTTVSDGLVDALVAWGGPDDVAERARQLHAAGADHVHLTVLSDSDQPAGLAAARALAPALEQLPRNESGE